MRLKRINILEHVVMSLVLIIIFVIISLTVCSCCTLSKRSCFPACPKPPPPTIIKVSIPCELPPKLVLPKVERTNDGCPESWVCYDPENAGKLAFRLASMRDWIREARIRCEDREVEEDDAPTGKITDPARAKR